MRANFGKDCRQVRQVAAAFPDIDDDGRLGVLAFRLEYQFEEFRDEPNRKVIDAVEAAIFERAEKGSFSGSTKTGNDQKLRRLHQTGDCALRLRLDPTDISVLAFVNDVDAVVLRITEHEKVLFRIADRNGSVIDTHGLG